MCHVTSAVFSVQKCLIKKMYHTVGMSFIITAYFFNLRTILVRMVSQAGTGFSFNTKRSRLREKLTLLHYDPIGKNQRSEPAVGSVLPGPVASFPDRTPPVVL